MSITSHKVALGFVIAILIVLQGILFVGAMHQETGGRWILPLDDAYIHQQYARQAAQGTPFRYNDEDAPTSGGTSLIYPFILATAWHLGARGDGLSVFSVVLGAITLLGSALLAARLAGRLLSARTVPHRRRVQWLSALLITTNGALIWGSLSGMETGLYILLVLAGMNAWMDRSIPGIILWGGLLVLTRPEGLPVMALLVALYLLHPDIREKAVLRNRLVLLALPLALGFTQPLLNLTLTGSFSASGMRAKSWLYNDSAHLLVTLGYIGRTLFNLIHTLVLGVRRDEVHLLGQQLISTPGGAALYLPPLLGAFGVGYAVRRAVGEARRRLPVQWVGLVLVIGAGLAINATMMTAEWHLYRYLLPFFALGLVAGAVAVGELLCRRHLCRRHRWVQLVVGGAVVLLSVASLPGFVWRYEEAARAIWRQPIRLAEWVHENLPPDARIGVHDVGAIRYYGGRSTYDVVGLTNAKGVADAWRQGSGAMYEAMERAEPSPDYFAIYDDIWTLPYLAKTSLFDQELFRVDHIELTDIAVASGHQVVYRADWSLRHSGATIYQPNVLDIIEGLTVVDALDVADLQSEHEHDYRSHHLPGHHGTTEVHQLTYPMPPHPEVIDGGRMTSGGESFTLSTEPGKDLVLVGRFMSPDDVWLDVRVNGRAAGQWFYPGFAGAWQERALHIPAAMISSERTVVDLLIQQDGADPVWHRSYYYWAFQGDPVRRDAEMQYAVNATTADGLRLLGYDMAVTRGEGIWQAQVTLYWVAEHPVKRDLKIFLHWVGADDTMLAQRDVRPQDEAQPTWMWQPGFVIVDTHGLEIPYQDVDGTTTLYVGTYEATTMEGSPLEGADPAGRYPLIQMELP